MEAVSPNRMSLLFLRDRLVSARKGLDLLKAKREALFRDFLPLWDHVVSDREGLQQRMGSACTALAASCGISGREELISASYAAAREIRTEIIQKNVWGVRLSVIPRKTLSRAVDARGYAFPGVSVGVDQSARAFEEVLEEILKLASEEVKLKKLGEELKRLGRRIRMLEDRIIPDLVEGIHRIQRVLEEREHEALFQLKRWKGRDV
ncbi:MAG: V-type ATP synthase subunit D [Nitrospirae bacterium]|nr:V-type ATP synthase subunit D [Nitrospirota bacterium]